MANEAAKKKVLDLIADAERPAPAPAAPAKPDARAATLKLLEEADAAPPPNDSRGTGVKTDPLPIAETRPINQSMATEAAALGLPTETGPAEIEQKAAAAGVLYDRPAPAGHALASFAANDEERRRAYEMALSEEYGQQILVEPGAATGALEYYDPREGRFALVEPPNRSLMDDIGAAAGGSMVMVPELMGGAAAGLLTKSPFLTSLGGSAGAFAGEVGRLLTGQSLGINQGLSDADIALEASKTAGLSLAAGVAGSKALQFVQFMRHAWNGDAVKYAAKAGERLGVSIEDAAALQDQINSTLAAERMRVGARNADLPSKLRTPEPEDRRFMLTLGEAAADPDLLAFQDGLKRSSKYQAAFGAFDQERQQALKDFYDLLGRPFSKSSLTGDQTAEGVRRAGATRLGYEQRRASEHLARYEADAANALADVDTMPMHQFGDVARGVGEAEQAAFEGRAEALAGNIRALAGGTRFIENKNLSEVFNKLNDRSRNLIISSLRRDARKKQMIPPKTYQTEEGEAKLTPVFDPNKKWTFAQSWDTLSRLKQVVRDGSNSDMDIGAVRNMIGAIEKDLYEAANKTELGPMYRDFTQWYRREKTRLNQGVVGKILQREGGPGGRFTFASEEAFRSVFPATSARSGFGLTPTREFLDLVKHDPQAITAFRNAIGDDWRNFVVRDGRVDPARHSQWLDMHREQLGLRIPGLSTEERRALGRFGVGEPANAGDALFTADELKAIGRAEGFEKALQAREKQVAQAVKDLNQTFNAKLTSIEDVGQVLQLVKGDLDGSKAAKLVGILKNPGTTDVLRGVRAEYLKDMRERVMTGRHPTTQEPILSAKGLRKFLYGASGEAERGQMEVVRELYGDKYAEGLATLEKAMTTTARETTYPNRSNTSGWWEMGRLLVRAKFGVISKEARVFTSIAMMNRANADRVLAKAIMNPGDMKRLMAIWKGDIRNRKVAAVASQLGFGPADMGQPDEE